MKIEKNSISRIIKVLQTKNEIISLISFILLFSVFAILVKKPWFNNLNSLFRDLSWVGTVAVGQTVLLISGEFDLSVGSVYAFVGMVFVLLVQTGMGVVPAFLIALVVALLIGFLNGYISLKFKIPSLLVTLGFLFVYRGAVYLISGGFNVVFPDSFRESTFIKYLGGEPMGFYTSILVFALIAILITITLSKTRFGNHVFAVGGDTATALSCGVSSTKIKMTSFMLCSLLAGLAGIMVSCTFSGVGPTMGDGLEFETIAGAVIGGTALGGGIGTILGTILGAGTLLALRAGLVLVGVNVYVFRILLGPLLISAVAMKEAMPGLFKNR